LKIIGLLIQSFINLSYNKLQFQANIVYQYTLIEILFKMEQIKDVIEELEKMEKEKEERNK